MNDYHNYLPNLFIAGAAKSGTSTLHDYLCQHPELCMSPNKEPNYFCREDKSLSDYKTIFWECTGRKFRGDSSTSYMVLPDVASRIKAIIRDPYFIFVFRNPVERAWSHYWWAKGRFGVDTRGFREAFLADMKTVPSVTSFNQQIADKHYFQTGLYSKWLQVYVDLFNSDRILILEFSELVTNPEEALRKVFDFLDVRRLKDIQDPYTNPTGLVRFPCLLTSHAKLSRTFANTIGRTLPNPVMNRLIHYNHRFFNILIALLSHGRPPKLNDNDRNWISNFYRNDVEQLRTRTGLAFNAWNIDFPPVDAFELN